ncbi:type II secretion system protein J [Patescibacteria group bacterium]
MKINIKNKKEKGMTLVELIVAIAVMGIVMTGMTLMISNLWKGREVEVKMGQSAILASQTVSKMVKEMRKSSQADSGAYFLAYGNDFETIFYSDIDNDGYMERVHYYVEGTQLKRGIAEPILGINPTYPEADEVITTMSNHIVNEAGEPIFTYYDSSGVAVDTPVQTSYVTLVKVVVHINIDPGEIKDVIIRSSASFRNIEI